MILKWCDKLSIVTISIEVGCLALYACDSYDDFYFDDVDDDDDIDDDEDVDGEKSNWYRPLALVGEPE